MSVNDFYVYVYLDPRKQGKYVFGEYEFDYEPFYVGKGCKNRCFKHLHHSAQIYNSHKGNKIKKILNFGLSPIIVKHTTGLTETDAYIIESRMIKQIGRHNLNTGPLTNLSDGGKGGHRNSSSDLRYRMGSGTRGKTYEEIYGIVKGTEMRLKRIESNKKRDITKKIDRSNLTSIQIKHIEKTRTTKNNDIWVLTSPNNDAFITRNLLKTCAELKIRRQSISNLGRGKIRYYNGWFVTVHKSSQLNQVKKELEEKM